MPTKPRVKKPSISVTAPVYDRVRDALGTASVQKFVDGILVSALNDPTICARVLEKCRLELE